MFNGNYDSAPTKQAKGTRPFAWRGCIYGVDKPTQSAEKLAVKQRRSGRVLLVVSLAPWLNLAAWTVYAEVSRMTLGHYPHYMVESVPSFVDDTFGSAAGLGLLLLVSSVPVWVGLTIWRTSQWKDSIVWRAALIYGLGWASTILICLLDPVGFVNWFID